jgi:hypothetical protein
MAKAMPYGTFDITGGIKTPPFLFLLLKKPVSQTDRL